MAETVMPSNVQQDKVVNNLTTTAAGYVLDARKGKELADKLADGVYVSNCDNATEANISYYADVNSTNKPSSGWCLIRVIGKSGNYFTQIATTENTTDGLMWYRTKTSSSFGDWKQIALDTDITTLSNNAKRLQATQSIALKSNATSTITTVNTYNGRKFSDYWSLTFVLHDSASSNNIRNTVTIPQALWTTGVTVFVIQNHGASLENRSGIQFTYDSDTSFKVLTNGSNLLTGYQIVGSVSML